jgi:ATP-binding cassette, subfamily B, bacterial
VFVTWVIHAPAAQILLVLAAGAGLAAYVRAAVGEIGFLRGFWADGSRRLAWLEDYAAKEDAAGDLEAPAILHNGIRFEHVSFAYPGTERLVLEDVSVGRSEG